MHRDRTPSLRPIHIFITLHLGATIEGALSCWQSSAATDAKHMAAIRTSYQCNKGSKNIFGHVTDYMYFCRFGNPLIGRPLY